MSPWIKRESMVWPPANCWGWRETRWLDKYVIISAKNSKCVDLPQKDLFSNFNKEWDSCSLFHLLVSRQPSVFLSQRQNSSCDSQACLWSHSCRYHFHFPVLAHGHVRERQQLVCSFQTISSSLTTSLSVCQTSFKWWLWIPESLSGFLKQKSNSPLGKRAQIAMCFSKVSFSLIKGFQNFAGNGTKSALV